MDSSHSAVRFGTAALVSLLFTLSATGADAASFRVTGPTAGTYDDWPAVVAVDGDFQVAWQHFDSTGNSSIQIRRFGPDAKPVAAAKQVVAPTALIGHPRLLPVRSGKLGLTWLDTTLGIAGTTVDTTTGAVATPKGLTKPSATHYDVARLSNGNIIAGHVSVDISNTSNIRVRARVSVASSSFGVVVKNANLPGSDNPLTTPGSADQAVVGDGAGGALAFYRDRTDGRLYVVKVSSAGVPAATRTRVDTTTMQVGGAAAMSEFGVRAVRLGDGRYAVAWTSIETSDLTRSNLRLRWLDASGKPIGSAVQVNTGTLGSQGWPRLVALSGGRLGVAWIQDEGAARRHRIRWYSAAGAPLTAVQTLRSDTEIYDPAGFDMTRLKDGRVVQVWRSYDPVASRYHIRGEFLTPPN